MWLRSQIAGLLWGGFMYLFAADEPHTVTQAAVYLAGGMVFGLAFWWLTRSQERRLFGDLSDAERATATAAVRAGRRPEDPRLRDAATRLARRWTRRGTRPAYHVIVFVFFLLLSIYVAIDVTPWSWFGVVFWPLAGWLSWRTERGQRLAAERFLS
ncbi:hypothetical protein Asi03nite_59990 [Actinoplanes siamensis]|uniref:Uncharacterized protein n=1 Tax=Actinoplanes siamensis TaxID=1223317 RepID=A0A919NCQ4_9ACTN|nr:hypothetical protein Asi03nite_59990 [Actinoplanes siamensis]